MYDKMYAAMYNFHFCIAHVDWMEVCYAKMYIIL